MTNKTKIILACVIVFLAAASRLVKHPFNFTPVAAMALFAGVYLEKKWAVILPVAAMFVSDYFLGFYDWQVMSSVYLGITLTFFIGWFLKSHKKWYFIMGGSIFSSILFFVITNLSVWAFFDWYPHTLKGLLSCFTLALPFFRNSLMGDVIYSGLFVAVYEAVVRAVNKKYLAAEKVEI